MRVRFGDFTLDTATRQLRRGAVERHLSPKGFDLLRLLIESRPRVVSKRELHERLWPATFVSEATLSSLIAEVRDALGVRGQSGHGVIRTVHRIGYGFDGDASDAPERQADAHVRCWLVWNLGQVALRDGEHLLGRDGDVTVMLDSTTVSRRHARIRVDGDSATIERYRQPQRHVRARSADRRAVAARRRRRDHARIRDGQIPPRAHRRADRNRRTLSYRPSMRYPCRARTRA